MEKLKEHIEGIISDHSGIITTNYDGMRDTIASEVQDIAIEFYCDRLGIDRNEKLMSVSKDGVISWKTIEESFTEFIKQYYK